MAGARRVWADAAPKLNPTKLVFLDETWAAECTAYLRRCGYAQSGR